jgi:4-hydroxy-L-threonine phosphate dehydrogenase PdxA
VTANVTANLTGASPGRQTVDPATGGDSGKPCIALVIGDPAGIGPELVARLLADSSTRPPSRVLLIGSRDAIEAGASSAGLSSPLQAADVELVDWPGVGRGPFPRAVAGADNGEFMLQMLALGASMVQQRQADALCFAPLNKSALRAGGMQTEDELRWFAELLRWHGSCGELNVLDSLWTSRVTSHIPLKDVAENLSPGRVADAIAMITEALRAAGKPQPQIAVCGLNPHNGDNGNFGREEIDVIAPGIAQSIQAGYPADGPFPADTIFVRARGGAYDGIVTMYHDQGQIAMKLMGFERGVTVQGGLPIPVTTPAHGTAYDIAGQGVANPGAMRAAFALACAMGLQRRRGLV